MNDQLQLTSVRAQEARFGAAIGRSGFWLLLGTSVVLGVLAVALGVVINWHIGFLMLPTAIICLLVAIWWKRRLSVLPPAGSSLNERLGVDVLARLKPGMSLQPQAVWGALSDHWQARFFTNHLLLSSDLIASHLPTDEAALAPALAAAAQMADGQSSQIIDIGYVVAGLLQTSSAFSHLLTTIKAQPSDVGAIAAWLGRNLSEERLRKQNYGGVARDWAFGFTPLLDRYGLNVSRGIMRHGAHFGWLTNSDGVLAMEAAFKNHTAAIALVGPDGIGKTNSVYALAQRLIEGTTDKSLAYHQIIALNATDITSRARGPGDLEHIMLSLANEASHAGHVILFFDDAQLFFSGGPGSFDATQILLSIIQARVVPVVLAMTPPDYQRLKGQNQSLASLLTPVVLQEQPESGIMRVLEDNAVGIENRHKVLVAYEAIREAYRLSGRYEQEEAYPGKAIKLLEQAVSHADHEAITAVSVQQAIEQTHGIKVGNAAPAEASALLNLEVEIHKRMINQSHAVGVVANALRRARAGVTNPRRPIGSFLFLGPTGVGKTELAKAIAATYFGSEKSLIRLDMSEYQQPDDVQRLLASGQNEAASLIMSVRQTPFSVVLLDEIEKAHPNVLNLMLQLLDEGQLTDATGRPASFKDCIIIVTSNAGAASIREHIDQGESLESFTPAFTDELIKSGQFKPELLNRFDDMVLFRPLTAEELGQVVRLMMNEVNQTLANQNISVELTDAAVQKIVAEGNDPRLGARPMRRALQRAVEDTIAQKILKNEARPGDHITLDAPDLSL